MGDDEREPWRSGLTRPSRPRSTCASMVKIKEAEMAELTRRYIVMPMATEAPFDPSDADAVFVLKPRKDPAALKALEAYRDHCYPELRRDLDAWIETIKAGPVLRGGV